MLKQLRLRINNRIVAWASVLGVGLLPCPDCGVPLAAHIWPVAAVVWVYRRLRRHGERQYDLWLTNDLRAKAGEVVSPETGEVAG